MTDEKPAPAGDPVATAIAAIRDARPPTTDPLTYLMIIEANLSVDVLPTLDEILHDAELTQQVGWDLVYNLVNLPGSEACLETIARLGNPREVILKVLEALELLHIGSDDDEDEEEDEETQAPPPRTPKEKQFITLLGMLGILHKRIKTRFPSRFLAQTLHTVYNTYRPTQEVTAAVIHLVHSLSGRRRPALPSRKSSVNIANLEQDGDDRGRTNAPDPEAEDKDDAEEDAAELAMQNKLLLSFATCVLETYANTHEMGWAARLVEFYAPEKLVPGRKTVMAAFRDEQELLERDAIVGQLVALIRDLGINSADEKFLEVSFSGPVANNPLSKTDDAKGPDDVALSTGGCVSLVAYWVFSETVFDADQPLPQMHIFPDHHLLLQKFLQEDAEDQIRESSGTIESLVTIGLWLLHSNRLSSPTTTTLTASSKPNAADDDTTSDYMRYLHLVTLVAVFHPRLHVRNAAISLAGAVLHADPSQEDRLRILYDLLENCVFSSLKACAITWLRDEILASDAAGTELFASQHPLEEVQYAVFPNLDSLREMEDGELAEWVVQNAPFLVQAANFGLFLWTAVGRWAKVLPANAEATVKERWWSPLMEGLARLGGEDVPGEVPGEVEVLRDRLARLAGAEGFSKDGADRAEWVRKGQDLLEKEEEAVGKFW